MNRVLFNIVGKLPVIGLAFRTSNDPLFGSNSMHDFYEKFDANEQKILFSYLNTHPDEALTYSLIAKLLKK